MRLILGETEVDFSIISNSDIINNRVVEIPVQDLLDVARNHGASCSIFAMFDVDITTPDRRLERNYELVEEQVYFARELIDKLQLIITQYPNTGGAKNLKADILTAVEESMFER